MRNEQDSDFIRQRRNLMIVSLVLLFSEVSELKISKLSVFGNNFLLGQPRPVSGALWVAGLYWLLRFYQYSRPRFTAAIRDAVNRRTEQIPPPTALPVILKAHPELLEERLPDIPIDPEVSVKKCTIAEHRAEYLDLHVELQKAAAIENSGAAGGLEHARSESTGSLFENFDYVHGFTLLCIPPTLLSTFFRISSLVYRWPAWFSRRLLHRSTDSERFMYCY